VVIGVASAFVPAVFASRRNIVEAIGLRVSERNAIEVSPRYSEGSDRRRIRRCFGVPQHDNLRD
jgi:hypothetical protein